MNREKLEKLASERSNPCITISINTHRTHPENLQDAITLKNILKETRERVLNEFGKDHVNGLLKKIDGLENEIDINHNLDSLHIFFSGSTKEIIRSPFSTAQNALLVAEKFGIKPLIKLYNRTQEYLILLLSQPGARLFLAVNDSITEEIRNENFPFKKDEIEMSDKETLIGGNEPDNLMMEYLNKIDKAVLKLHYKLGLKCVVICNDNNYSHLLKVADKPDIYPGHVKINYKDTSNHTIAAAAWKAIEELQRRHTAEEVKKMKEEAGKGKVITELQEIYSAAKEGRGETVVCRDDYHQPVKMTGEFTFDTVDDASAPGVIDDIVSEIVWEVISKKGRAIFTNPEEKKPLGDIALKVRY
jgi:hypothetical protein